MQHKHNLDLTLLCEKWNLGLSLMYNTTHAIECHLSIYDLIQCSEYEKIIKIYASSSKKSYLST